MGSRRDGVIETGYLRGALASPKLVILAFVLFTIGWPTLANDTFVLVRNAITEWAGWLYTFIVTAALVLCVVLMVSRWGAVRLGSDEERPEFGWISWFAMLFAAGMGIGLVFYSVAEPLGHYAGNPLVSAFGTEPGDLLRARVAMEITYFHWGLMPWGLYALLGLIFAYFSFRKGEPLTLKAALRPLLGDAVERWPGKVVDIVTIVATVFGIATSLGLGAEQINGGLNRLLGWEVSQLNTLLVVAVIMGAAVISVSTGLERGIRLLSLANIWLAAVVLIVVLASAPIEPVLRNLTVRVATHLGNLPWLTYATAADDTGWSSSWTIFYWAWWISWTPFVGLFIARISRGRTVREFILGVLLVPTAVTFIWLAVLGGAAFTAARAEPGIVEIANSTPSLSLYALIDFLLPGPFAAVLALLATLLVAVFFVTSADSGTLIVATLDCGGNPEPPLWDRLVWGVGIAVVAAALLYTDGLNALQAVAIAAALPFAILLIAFTGGLFMALRGETRPALMRA